MLSLDPVATGLDFVEPGGLEPANPLLAKQVRYQLRQGPAVDELAR